MKKSKKDELLECTTLNELLDVEYGVEGTPTREKFEEETRDTLRSLEENSSKIV